MPRSRSALLSLPNFSAINLSAFILCIVSLSTLALAAAPDRITGSLAGQTVRLSGGAPVQARPEFDQGPVEPSLQLSYMTLLTVPSASQQRAIQRLLAQQQDRRSPQYHKWLTPEQYADRFGLSPSDIQNLTTWLRSQGFAVLSVARGRNFIVFSGTAAQAERAFQTEIHHFKVDGEMHFANTTPPVIPAALSGVVTGVRGLNDFRPKSQAVRANPEYTFTYKGSSYNFLAPGDIATIYDINTLYGNGIDGTGYKLAVIGETGIYQSDLTNFRQNFGLSAISCTVSSDIITACNTSNFRYILVNGSATSVYSDLPEADIDIEWSGAAARNAQVNYVTANATNVYDSMYYTIDNDVAPVMTMSYTTPCELAEIGFFASDEAEFQKANVEGITFLNSAGDTGAAECDFGANIAVVGYAVAYPASSQYVTGVGGTSIPAISPNEYTSTYWNASNNGDGGSAKTYIPEQPWNDAEEFGLLCAANPSDSFCTNNGITNWATAQTAFGISSGGGGVSNCVTVDVNGVCQSGFPQPAWQLGLSASAVNPGGIGEINAATATRYSPEVSLLASPNFPGYLICTQINGSGGGGSSCDSASTGIQDMLNGCFAGTGPCTIYGGTSVASPVFAGIVTLLNQDAVVSGLQPTPGLGNINPTLYSLAAANSTNQAFNPVTTSSSGAYSNGAWCTPGTPNSGVPADPWPPNLQCPNSGFLGFNAYDADPTIGYNLVTGLGSVNASHLAAALVNAGSPTTTTLISSLNPSASGVAVTFTATVATSGTNPPTGTVTFNDGTTSLGTGTLNGSLIATLTTSALAVGANSITAVYGGDANNASSTSPVLTQTVSVPDFKVTNTGVTTQTVLAGVSGVGYGFTVAPVAPATTFGATVTLACSGLDATTSCVFNPASIAATAGSTPVTLTMTTSGPNTVGAARPKQRADNRLPWLPFTVPIASVVMLGLAGRRVSRYSAIAGLCVALGMAGLLLACGGGNTPINVSAVSPNSVSMWPNDTADGWPSSTQTFAATVNNNSAVNWSLSPSGASSGSIDASGSYTAPTVAAGLPQTVTVTATSQQDSTKFNTAIVTLKVATVPQTFSNVVVTVTDTTTPPTAHNLAPLTLVVQ
jgi:subtilase family serine protease